MSLIYSGDPRPRRRATFLPYRFTPVYRPPSWLWRATWTVYGLLAGWVLLRAIDFALWGAR